MAIFDPKILDLFLNNLDEVREIQSRYVDREEDYDKFQDLEYLIIEEEESEKKA